MWIRVKVACLFFHLDTGVSLWHLQTIHAEYPVTVFIVHRVRPCQSSILTGCVLVFRTGFYFNLYFSIIASHVALLWFFFLFRWFQDIPKFIHKICNFISYIKTERLVIYFINTLAIDLICWPILHAKINACLSHRMHAIVYIKSWSMLF